MKPYNITKSEYRKVFFPDTEFIKLVTNGYIKQAEAKMRVASKRHFRAVYYALCDELKVPYHVLQDYPELRLAFNDH